MNGDARLGLALALVAVLVVVIPILVLVLEVYQVKVNWSYRRSIWRLLGDFLDRIDGRWRERSDAPVPESEPDPAENSSGPSLFEDAPVLEKTDHEGLPELGSYRSIEEATFALARSAARTRYSPAKLERLFEPAARRSLYRGIALDEPADRRFVAVNLVYREGDRGSVERFELRFRDRWLELPWLEKRFGAFTLTVDREGYSVFRFRVFRGGLLRSVSATVNCPWYRADVPTALDETLVAEVVARSGFESHECLARLEGIERRVVAVARREVRFDNLTFSYLT